MAEIETELISFVDEYNNLLDIWEFLLEQNVLYLDGKLKTAPMPAFVSLNKQEQDIAMEVM